MRRRREGLSAQQQLQAAKGLLDAVSGVPEFQSARRVGFYLANGGEIDPSPVTQLAARAGKACYFPVLHPLKYNRLYFVRHREGDRFNSNRFGISEPELRAHRTVPAWSLQIIFIPLLAFDGRGNRLGMGGGYYDRSLAFTRNKPGSRPLLIGLAHSFQQVDHLEASPWDIPLHGVATEREFIPIKKLPSRITIQRGLNA